MTPLSAITPILADSDVLIEVLRARDKQMVRHWIDLVDSFGPIFYSPVSSAEIWAGAKQKERSSIETLFEALECIAISAAIGEKAGEYLRLYHATHAVELGDALIAATASLNGLSLWTRNHKHFPMRELRFFPTAMRP